MKNCHFLALAVLTLGVFTPIAASHAQSPPPDSVAIARDLLENRRFDVAEPLIRRLLARVEQEEGPETAAAAVLLDLLIESLWRSRGRSAAEEALPLIDRVVRLKQRLHGPDHLEVANSLFNLGVIHTMTGKTAEAEGVFRRVLDIREASLPSGDEAVLEAMNALANVKRAEEDYEGAIEVSRRGLRLAEAAGKPFSNSAKLLRGGLGSSLFHLNRFDEARALLEPQVAHYDSTNHPTLSSSLNMLANIELSTGDLLRAATLYRRALALEEMRAGPLSRWAIAIRGNCAVVLVRLGEYEEARSLLDTQADHLESAGRRDETLGLTYTRLAHVASELGDYERELELRQRSLTILEENLPPQSTRIADALFNLGTVYGNLNRLDDHEAMVQRALEIWTACQLPQYKYLSHCHSALASIAYKRGDLAGAREQTEEALRLVREVTGEDSPQVAEVLDQLGEMLGEEGRFDRARELMEQAIDIVARRIGPAHPLTAGYMAHLAQLEFEAGRTSVAIERAFDAEGILTPHLRLTLRTLPERQALLYSSERAGLIDLLLSSLDRSSDPSLTSRVWDAVIRTRGLVFDELASRPQGRRSEADIDAYQRASTRLTHLVVGGPGDAEPDVYQRLIADARRDMEEAERASLHGAAHPDIGLTDVARALPNGWALIAYARYQRPDSTRARYRAFVLAAPDASPVTISLGDADGIDDLIKDWREETQRVARQRDPIPAETGRILRRLLWDPLAPYVEEAPRVLIVPDDRIHLVRLAALPDEAGTYLIESPRILHQLTTEREIVTLQSAPEASQGALVIGDPDFDQIPVAKAQRVMAESAFRGEHPACLDSESMRFAPLPASRREAQDVAASWARWCSRDDEPLLLLTGRDAHEAAFKRGSPGRRLLHLATHGYLLDASCFADATGDPATPSLAANPLLFSGLALAGANRRDQSTSGGEDGILTAQEIAALDLTGVRWAILSACDSRGSDVLDDEGVFGLQRAFRIAGARTVIASLWPVRDDVARSWMRAFYQSTLEQGSSTAAAVRDASLSVLRQQRAHGADTHPFHWGAFVATGDWR